MEIDRILERFTNPDTGSLHGAVFIAVDKSGREIYHNAVGRASFDSNTNLVTSDSLCWIASMTKLVTAVAVMQLVERGLISLDDNVCEIIPELKNMKVFEHERNDTSTLNAPRVQDMNDVMTVRHLMTHSSGFVYDSSSALLTEWSKSQGRSAHTFCGSLDGYNHPLMFRPGRSWGYGGGIDWAGRMVEIKAGTSLETFMRKNIWSKLGAESTTFHPEVHLDTLPAPLEMGHRKSVGEGTKSVTQGKITLQQPARDDLGGIGLFSTPRDYMKLLGALLSGGHPLLNDTSVNTLFRPQLSDASRLAMPKGLGIQMRRVLGIHPSNTSLQADHCLAGTIAMGDIPGRRRAGTVNWSGLPNLHWWIDRKTGIAAGLFTQIMPPGDPAVTGLVIDLEEALYQFIASGKAFKL